VKISDSTSARELDGRIDAANSAVESGEMGPLATEVIAIHYNSINYGGINLTLTDTTNCPGHPTRLWPNFRAPWNNIFESSRLFAGCRGNGYDNPVIDGPGAAYAYTCEQWVPNLGSASTISNKMSSFKAWSGGC